ncbi:peptidoglycan-binding protein LysM [Olleya sp. YS]|uniref:peptidoglycan-binding protein LysM n=1 Tax=Olleya sp. YS TaxID=3028318 RepID=UPI00243465B9|nr:peptidoglycan-binding protein LysM [Olleya sp. YS]WGD34816.1 peptidoglycan-binding protein LysM [Olleya sp. YS]
MKNIGKFLSLVLTISILVVIVISIQPAPKQLKEQKVTVENCYQPESYSPHLGKTFTGFKEALGFKESQNDYFRVNQYGYLGKYQFGKSTLKVIGIHHPNFFLNNPELQEKAFIANAQRNKWVLRRDIKRFNGKYVSGVKVTESGILAAAHLAGPGSVKKFLRSYGEQNFADANGATIKYYMKKFSGYDTSLIKPLKKVKVKYNRA